MRQFPLFIAFLLCAFLAVAGEIPPPPANNAFVSDFAALITPEVHQRITDAQQIAFEKYNTPIIVVTIPRMSDYGAEGVSIEDFARGWFNKWRIGTLDAKEQGANKGILLLVSSGDRKARIELGADWGRDWDGHCNQIMESEIIPKFKQGKFSEGIAIGVEKLSEMAAKGPASSPPPADLIRRIDNKLKENPNVEMARSFNPYPTWVGILMMVAGAGCIVASFFFPDQRKALLITGIVLLVAGFSFILILIALAAFAKSRGGGSGGGSFGGYSGGGFSGGFSGGGGASGSW